MGVSMGQGEAFEEGGCEFDSGVQEVPYQ